MSALRSGWKSPGGYGSLLVAAFLLAGSSHLLAQEQKKTPPVEASVELRWRTEFRDNLDFQPTDDADQFTGQRIRINLTFNLRKDLKFFFQGQDVWLYGAERDKIIHDFNTNLHQAYFDWKIPVMDDAKLRVGRQEFNYGRQRLLGGFGWDNVSRSFDGARLRFDGLDWDIDILAGRLVDIRRRGSRRRPGNLDISGIYVALKNPPDVEAPYLEFYGLFLRDSLRSGGELGSTPETKRIITPGVRSYYQPDTGLQFEIENAWQFGERGPDDHKAMMLVGNGGYIWDAPLKPMLKFEYAYASGDNNPADGKSREFHNLFPTNHIHYGYADLEGLRNLHDFRVTAAAQVRPKVRVEADFHKFLLAAKRGPWKNAGGAVLGIDPTGQSGRDVGQELDFTVRLPLWKHLGFLAGYSVFFPGDFAKATRGNETHHWGYVQTTVRF